MKIKQFKVRLVPDGIHEYSLLQINNTVDAYIIFSKDFDGLPHEEVMAIFLNGRNKIIGKSLLAMGGLHGCALTPQDVFRAAITANATAIILGHNHPSGDPTPSAEDVALTKKVREVGEVLGITLHDHLVIAGGIYRSCNDY